MTHNRIVAEALRQLASRPEGLRITVSGSSMKPLIRSGDVLVVKACGVETLHWGDLAVFDAGTGHLLAHRYFGRTGRGDLRFCGDARFRRDGPVSPGSLVAKAVVVERSGKRISLEGPHGRLLNTAAATVTTLLRPLRALRAVLHCVRH